MKRIKVEVVVAKSDSGRYYIGDDIMLIPLGKEFMFYKLHALIDSLIEESKVKHGNQ